MSNRLIISGYKGFIGSNFCKFLKKKKIKFLKYDFRKNSQIYSGCSHFFHLDFEIKNKKDSLKINKKKILDVLKICSKNKIKLIFPSTSSYKYNNKNKKTSNSIFALNEYSNSKIQCEKQIINYNKRLKLNFLIFRIFNVYGKDLKNRGVVAALFKRFKKNKEIKLKNSENLRDFINIDDLLNLFFKSLKVNKNGIFDVGTESILSIKDLAFKIKKIHNFRCKINCVKPLKSSQNYYSKSDTKKTKKIFSWRPLIKINDGLKNIKI